VPFRNAAGEIVIVVALSQDERFDASGKRAPVGGRDSLICQGYALRRGYKIAPSGFEPVVSNIEFVTLHG
jgi:hypothetical protein